MSLEPEARKIIDRLLEAAGWLIFDNDKANIYAAHGFADYLLYIDGKAAGVIEAKKAGTTLSGVEIQSKKYKEGLPHALPSWAHPLPFAYESTGIETHFTNGLDPKPRSRDVFAFHRPEQLASWLNTPKHQIADSSLPMSWMIHLACVSAQYSACIRYKGRGEGIKCLFHAHFIGMLIISFKRVFTCSRIRRARPFPIV